MIRVTYLHNYVDGRILGNATLLDDGAYFINSATPQEGAHDFLVDVVDDPLGRYFDLLVEEDGVWWWGYGYPDIMTHPDLRGGVPLRGLSRRLRKPHQK